jgi:hypothetical protein
MNQHSDQKADTNTAQHRQVFQPATLGGDFAQGIRMMPASGDRPDFARGVRTLPQPEGGPDFARGVRTLQPVPEGPDYARGLDQ